MSMQIPTFILKKWLLLCCAQLLSCAQLFVTQWTAACQASLSFISSQSLLKFMSIESVMPSNHLNLTRLVGFYFLLCSPKISINNGKLGKITAWTPTLLARWKKKKKAANFFPNPHPVISKCSCPLTCIFPYVSHCEIPSVERPRYFSETEKKVNQSTEKVRTTRD